MRRAILGLGLLWFAAACSKGEARERPVSRGEVDPLDKVEKVEPKPVASASPSASIAPAATATATPTSTKPTFAAWLKTKLPEGGVVQGGEGGEPARVVHRAKAGDTALSIAQAYVDLTDVYLADDLAETIAKHKSLVAAPIAAGTEVPIPNLLREPYKEPKEDRLAWPEDKILRGVFLTGLMAGRQYISILDKLVDRGLNAIVLDGKDYMGPVNYPTKAKVAVETGAAKNVLIPNLARTVRFAHARGIRVILRLPCFHDPWVQKKAPRLSVMGNWGKPFPLGWLDPVNPEAQEYVFELAKEMAESGADEVQLDYIRFPVQGPLKSAVLPPAKDGERSRIIKEIVRKAAAIVRKEGARISLDIFGVAATGQQEDIEALGQEMGIIGGEADALMPMIYPSHYDAGYMGFAEPANHPEIIGIGSRASYDKLKKAKIEGTIIRPWLQAFSWRTPSYGPKYVADEVAQAEKYGTGWILWDPGCTYGAAWAGIPKKPKP